jgi:drug/metabolite transporter (DMT)-like permease
MGITPSLDMFFSKATLIITAILIGTQYSLIWAYKYAEKISLLQNIDYSRIFFTCLLAYLLFGESMESRQIFGLIIIVTSIILSHSGDLEMRKYSIVVLDSVKDKYKKYTNK